MKPVYLVASGDRQLAVNQKSWSAQSTLESRLIAAVERLGRPVRRAHSFDGKKEHGFIDSLKVGLAVFREIPVDAALIVPAAAQGGGDHLWPGLSTHEGPILTVAVWQGGRPGMAGLLALNGCLAKAGVKYSSLWSETCEDEGFQQGLQRWLERGKIKHDADHVRPFDLKSKDAPADLGDAMRTGRDFARRMRREKTILGIFGEEGVRSGNASVPDALLNLAGVFKEHLSESMLAAKMATVSEAEARAVCMWFQPSGRRFGFVTGEGTEWEEGEMLDQCRMYIAVVRLAEEFGCAAVGLPARASAWVAGLLNGMDRPPVYHERRGEELLLGDALPSFYGGNECAGVDGLVTYHLWKQLGYPPENMVYDLRWAQDYRDEQTDALVWTLEAAGAVLPAHLGGGGRGSGEERPPMDSASGVVDPGRSCKPGWIVWSRVYVEDERRLCYDTGIAEVVSLPITAAADRWRDMAAVWPVMHVVLQGITRDQMLARHKAGCVQVVYAPDKEGARRGLFAKAAAMREFGLEVAICGNISGER